MNEVDEKYIRKGYNLACFAIENNDLGKLQEALEKCPEAIDYWNNLNGTLLHIAAWEGAPELIEYLIKKGSDVDRVIAEKSPLSMAAMKGKVENVRKLIELGAKLDATTSFNNPLFCAIQSGNLEIAKILIEMGIDLSPVYKTKDNPWWDTLSYAKHYQRTGIALMIEEKLKEQDVAITQSEVKQEDGFEKTKKSLTCKYGEYLKKVTNLEYETIKVLVLKDFVTYLEADLKKAFLRFVENESENQPYQFSLCMNPNTYEMYWWSNGNTEESYETLKGKITNDETEKYYRFCPEEGCELDKESFEATNAFHEWLYELHTATEESEIGDEALEETCLALIEDLKEMLIEQSYQVMLKLKKEGFFATNCDIPLRLNFYVREREMDNMEEKIAVLNA